MLTEAWVLSQWASFHFLGAGLGQGSRWFLGSQSPESLSRCTGLASSSGQGQVRELCSGTEGRAELRGWGAREPVHGGEAAAFQNFAVGWRPWAPVSRVSRTPHVCSHVLEPWTSFLHLPHSVACSGPQGEPHVIWGANITSSEITAQNTSLRA